MNIWRSLGGIADVTLTSADLNGALQIIGTYGIAVQDVIYIDPIHLRFSVRDCDISRLIQLTQKRGEKITVLHRRGIHVSLQGLLRRPVLILGMLSLLLISCWIPTRVLFVQVEGNEMVTAKQIIEQADLCGIGFGSSRRAVRSEKIKNNLLASLPQLQWAGVNTYGCKAVITVRERSDLKEESKDESVSSIVALRDGIIREITVLQGNAVCQVGQAIKEGQILVSGYTDCGIYIQTCKAKAEIFGETQRSLSAIFPTEYAQRVNLSSKTKKYSLIIGKKRINFFKGSGISGDTCAKIYEEKYLSLPGGFVLPLGIACEQVFEYDTEPNQTTNGESVLSEFAVWYLGKEMLAGKIYRTNQIYSISDVFCRLDGIYDCYEMIGVSRQEEIIEGL